MYFLMFFECESMWSGSGRWCVGEDGGLCAKVDVQKGLRKCQLSLPSVR